MPISRDHRCVAGRQIRRDVPFQGLSFTFPCPREGVNLVRYPGSEVERWCCDDHFTALKTGGLLTEDGTWAL